MVPCAIFVQDWLQTPTDEELRFSPGRQSSTLLPPRANHRPRAEAHSQVGSLTAGCENEVGKRLIHIDWPAATGEAFAHGIALWHAVGVQGSMHSFPVGLQFCCWATFGWEAVDQAHVRNG